MSFPYGSTLKLTATFKNAAGQIADPTTITVSTKAPGANGDVVIKSYLVDPEVVRDGVGVYSYEVTLSTGGTWTCRFVGTGTVKAASFDYVIEIERSIFGT